MKLIIKTGDESYKNETPKATTKAINERPANAGAELCSDHFP